MIDFLFPRRSYFNPSGNERSLIPLTSQSDRALKGVIGIMCFLAALAVGGVSQIKTATHSWQASVAAEATIQIRPVAGQDLTTKTRQAFELVNETPGIESAKILDSDELAELLKPWLGEDADLAELPVPAMIALKLDQQNPPDFEILRAALGKISQGISLDTHLNWQNRLGQVSTSIVAMAYIILLVVMAATILVIMISARSAMASNQDVVRTLSLVGAEDRFIANEFQRHFFSISLKAACLGVILAMLLFWIGLSAGHLNPAALLAGSSLKISLDVGSIWQSFAWMASVALITLLLIAITTRITVYRVLNQA